MTPEAEAKRYDTRFYLLPMPKGQVGIHDQYETTSSFWAAPSRVLERWMAGEAVDVHRDSPITRLFRWSRRHKSFVAASPGLLLATLVGLAVGIVVVGYYLSVALVY